MVENHGISNQIWFFQGGFVAENLKVRLVLVVAMVAAVLSLSSMGAQTKTEGAGYRFERGGWTYVHLEGTPSEIGYQHGRLLSAEIADMVVVTKLENLHSTKRDWRFYRKAAQYVLWPHIEAEYREELEGIAKGVQSKGVKLDVWVLWR